MSDLNRYPWGVFYKGGDRDGELAFRATSRAEARVVAKKYTEGGRRAVSRRRVEGEPEPGPVAKVYGARLKVTGVRGDLPLSRHLRELSAAVRNFPLSQAPPLPGPERRLSYGTQPDRPGSYRIIASN